MTRRRRRTWVPRQLRVAFGGLALLGALGAGCTAARNTLGTSSGPCFRAVSVATDAVKDRGTLAGVRMLGARDLEKRPRLREVLSTRAGHDVKNVCAVAFSGQFRTADVHDSIGRGPAGGVGKIAVALVSYPEDHLLGTIVLSSVPLPFRHEVLGRTTAGRAASA